MKVKINKLLLVVILIWICSATYSSYVASKTDLRYSYSNRGVIDGLLDKVFPGQLSLKAKSAVLTDAVTGEVLYSKNENEQLPVASLTKLAAAIVFLNTQPDLNKVIAITEDDLKDAGRTRLYSGMSLKLYDCLHLCLMRSDNAATKALVRSTGMSPAQFISEMNGLTDDLGMNRTRFVEPTGRYAGNMSTALNMAELIKCASDHRIIADIFSKKMYEFKPANARESYMLYNTNRLLFSQWNIKGGKTGYITQAGYCLAFDFYDNSNRRINAVLLGAPSNQYRYRDANRLIAFASKN